jgi:hypothetical protein
MIMVYIENTIKHFNHTFMIVNTAKKYTGYTFEFLLLDWILSRLLTVYSSQFSWTYARLINQCDQWAQFQLFLSRLK